MKLIRLLLLPALASAALAARAADPSMDFTPSDSDMAVKFLDVLLGKTDGSTTVVSALAAGMQIFNLAALSFGTLLFTYIAVIGTLRTAEDGELLGKKWSSMWIPLRFTAGVALLVPLATGYSTAQHGMIWLAKQGSGVASAVWKASAHYIDTGGDRPTWQLSNPQFKTALDAAMRNVWRAEACAAAFRDRYSLTEEQFGLKVDYDGRDGSYLVQWGDTTPDRRTGWGPAQCGSIRTTAFMARDKGPFSILNDRGAQQQVYAPLNAGAQAANAQALKLVITAQASALQESAGRLRVSAASAVRPCGGGGEPQCADAATAVANLNAAVEEAKTAYIQRMETPLRNAYQTVVGNQKLEGRITDAGWAMAGTATYTAARVTSEINKLRDWTPAVLPPSEGAAPLDQVAGDVYSMTWASEIAAKSHDVSNTAGRGIAQWLAYKLAGDPEDTQRHILVQIKEGGDSIMTWSQTAMAAMSVGQAIGAGKVVQAAAAVAPIPGARVVADLLSKLGEGAMIAGLVLFMTGVVMSLVIPLLPFVLWAGSVGGWLIAVLEAIIAAPLWVAAHLHPDGEDLTGRASTGYMILLEVLLRPTFMVLGLVAALALVDVLGRWVGYAFWATTDSVQDDSWTGIASIVTLVVIYVGLTFTVTRMCFGLVHDVPATIMRWIGGNNATHDKGESFGQEAQGQINKGLARAEAPVVGALTGGTGGRRGGGRGAGAGAGRGSPANPEDPSGRYR